MSTTTTPSEDHHPPAVRRSALLRSPSRPSPRELLHAQIIGVEVACRMAIPLPSITTAAGTLPCTAAVRRGRRYRKLIGLDEQRLTGRWHRRDAVVGLRECLARCARASTGPAAQNGRLAAFLADAASTPRMRIERRAASQLLSPMQDYSEILDGSRAMGSGAELLQAFACGIVIHPTIDAASVP
jgi:hypothetical protein